MMYVAYLNNSKSKRGWRVACDYTSVGGTFQDICSAINEAVARETAAALNGWKK